MNPISATPGVPSLLHEQEALRGYWVWFLALGVAMVAFGTVAISWACLATITVAATWLFGFLLLAGGITEIINSFFAGRIVHHSFCKSEAAVIAGSGCGK